MFVQERETIVLHVVNSKFHMSIPSRKIKKTNEKKISPSSTPIKTYQVIEMSTFYLMSLHAYPIVLQSERFVGERNWLDFLPERRCLETERRC